MILSFDCSLLTPSWAASIESATGMSTLSSTLDVAVWTGPARSSPIFWGGFRALTR